MTIKKMQNLKSNWLVQNWHEEFNKFWPKHIMLQLRKYREVMFDGTQVD